VLLGIDAGAQAQSIYPVRPIHIIVPYPAGGIVDIVARTVTEQIGRDWKQSIRRGSKTRRQQQYRYRGGSQEAIPTATPGW
jgi:tripartite-type tricarboxylate transporter receptor subunit TctC